MKNIIVVDDFYSSPLVVRKVALEATYSDVSKLNYPGYQSNLCYTSQALKKAFSNLINEDLDIDDEKTTFGRFRLMNAEISSRLHIHVDGGIDWTGLVYLNLPDQCRGGTAFYRHKRTGLSGPPSEGSANSWGYDSAADFERSIVEPDTLNPDAWDITMFVAMRFNRLVLFRGSINFHSHTCSWGKGMADGRLTQNFFFNSSADKILKQPTHKLGTQRSII